MDFDSVFPRGGSDPPPRSIALGVADSLHLVEAGDRVANVPRVVEGLLALLWKSELLSRHAVALALAKRVCSGLPGGHAHKPPGVGLTQRGPVQPADPA